MIFFFLDDHVKRNPSRREIWKQARLSSRTHVEVDIFLRRSKYRERASFAGYVSSRVRRSFDEILITSFLLHVSRWLALCSISRYPEASTANNIGCTYVPSQPIIPYRDLWILPKVARIIKKKRKKVLQFDYTTPLIAEYLKDRRPALHLGCITNAKSVQSRVCISRLV